MKPTSLLELTPDGAGLEASVVQVDVISSGVGGDGRSQLRADHVAAGCVRAPHTIGVEIDDDRSGDPARGDVDVAGERVGDALPGQRPAEFGAVDRIAEEADPRLRRRPAPA